MSSDKSCSCKDCKNKGTLVCGGCGKEWYCSKNCQKSHWGDHKANCKRSPSSSNVSYNFDTLSIKQLTHIIKAKAAQLDNKPQMKLLTKLEQISEKPDLVKLASANIEQKDIENLLGADASSSSAIKKRATAAAIASSAKNSRNSIKFDGAAAAGGPMSVPTPAQMKQQAAMMKANPEAVRRAQPAIFGQLTDQQIIQYAEQMEKTADDPNLMKDVERVAKMNSADRGLLQSIQEGFTGTKPIDAAWIDMVVDAVRTKPKIFKMLFSGKGAAFGGLTDEQVESYIDYASQTSAWVLRAIAYAIWYIIGASKPIAKAYTTADEYSFGTAKYILMAVFGILMYYLAVMFFFVSKWVFLQLYAFFTFAYAKLIALTMASSAASTVGSVGVPITGETVNKGAATAGAAASAGSAARSAAAEFEF